MVNNSTNINKANNHLSSQIIEHIKATAYDIENPNPILGRPGLYLIFKRSLISNNSYISLETCIIKT
jgi:hypothetical protein